MHSLWIQFLECFQRITVYHVDITQRNVHLIGDHFPAVTQDIAVVKARLPKLLCFRPCWHPINLTDYLLLKVQTAFQFLFDIVC